ncbi:MAG: DUF3152 domain-containing protein [Corynebacterium sp.]|nr:DUF3152 domain-containing protein [Corynebacterium sp.]
MTENNPEQPPRRFRVRSPEEYERERLASTTTMAAAKKRPLLLDYRLWGVVVIAIISLWIIIDLIIRPGQPLLEVKSSDVGSVETPNNTTDPGYASPLALPNLLGALPPGQDYTQKGDDTYRSIAPVDDSTVGQGTQKAVRYTVEVENPIDTNAYGGDAAFVKLIESTLSSPLSWTKDSRFSFQHVDTAAQANLHIQLATPETVHRYCGHSIDAETSCYTSDGERVLINEARWVRGATTFQGDIGSYRQYVINHEVGHSLGYQHVACPADGELAPVMMQQTLSLSNADLIAIADAGDYENSGNHTCRFNAWPYPTG